MANNQSPLPTVISHCVKVPLNISHLTQGSEGAVLSVQAFFHQAVLPSGEILTSKTGYIVEQGGH